MIPIFDKFLGKCYTIIRTFRQERYGSSCGKFRTSDRPCEIFRRRTATQSGDGAGRRCSTNPRLHATLMWKALGFAMFLVVLAIFMPDVLRAIEAFLLAFFDKGAAIINSLPAQPASMQAMVR